MTVADLYPASPIKRHRATKAEVERHRGSLLDIVEALKAAEDSERTLIRQLVANLGEATDN